MSKYERHFFVCINQRPPGSKPSCGGRGSPELVAGLKEALAQREALWGKVAVTATTCLGPCFDGPTIVVYPEGTWYVGVTVDDLAEIVESHMVGGTPVERLQYQWPEE